MRILDSHNFSFDSDLTDLERNVLERLAKQYEAKTDATLSGGLVRITANFETCTEVFNALREILEEIQMKEISTPLPESKVHRDSLAGQLGLLGKLTNTVIRISDQSEKKVIASHLSRRYADFVSFASITSALEKMI